MDAKKIALCPFSAAFNNMISKSSTYRRSNCLYDYINACQSHYYNKGDNSISEGIYKTRIHSRRHPLIAAMVSRGVAAFLNTSLYVYTGIRGLYCSPNKWPIFQYAVRIEHYKNIA